MDGTSVLGPQATNSDDTSALQGYFDSLSDLARAALYPTVYRVFRPLTLLNKRVCIDCRGAVLDWYGRSGTVLTLGFGSGSVVAPGSAGYGWDVRGLSIQHTGVGESFYLNSSRGLLVQNIYGGLFDGINISGFGTGVSLVGDGTGCTCGRLGVSNLSNNGASMWVYSVNGGYVTEWNIDGGNWQYSSVADGTAPTHVLVQGPQAGGLRLNGCCFQGRPGVVWADLSNCDHVIMRDCRYEKTDETTANVTLETTAHNCALVGVTSPGVAWNDLSAGANGHVYLPNWH